MDIGRRHQQSNILPYSFSEQYEIELERKMLEEELQAEWIFRRMLLVRQEDGASNAEPTRLNSHSLTVDAEDDILKVRSQYWTGICIATSNAGCTRQAVQRRTRI